MTSRPTLRRPSLSILTWVMLAASVLLVVLGTATSGLSGLLLMTGLIGALTALYALVTGRKSWATIPSRKFAAVALAGSLVVTIIGASVAPATVEDAPAAASDVSTSVPTPTPAPTDAAPLDPDTPSGASADPSVVVADPSATDLVATALLATLAVKGRAAKTGYDRTESFGSAWLDVDQNGCDTRNDILARDLTNIVKSGECRVLTGTLQGPYTGKTISFMRGEDTSSLVQIDHVVALSNAWQTGAQQLTQAERESLANDPLNLLAVDGPTNSSKGDGDSATWLPPQKSYRCAYVARQISVKASYGLWVTSSEQDSMTRILATCPEQRAATSGFAPAEPAPAPPVESAPAEVYYENCTAARAAGAAPVQAGDAGYGRHLDRDGDGTGCE
ncbi:GmrSD restriction endonuclease domain-containing protein [Cryobacterium roopkundense]|nr:DUF1524 domain-containing protein [Cryobacterium roopkundense]MBB5639850.1 hypothetical protein [Cryobacterium roopkundense]